MSKPLAAAPVKLVISILALTGEAINGGLKILSQQYGAPDYIGLPQSFAYSNYYEREMGSPLCRRFIFFEKLIPPESLPDIKNRCNSVEEDTSFSGKRTINLDPGYLALPHLILATGKGYAHRPYLRDGIYADLTLIYEGGSYRPLPWTYPDYASPPILGMFNCLRERYLLQRKISAGDNVNGHTTPGYPGYGRAHSQGVLNSDS